MQRRVCVVALVLAGSPRARAPSDFFSSSPGPLSASATRRSTTRITATTATSTTRKDLSNDKCLGCHDHHDLRDRGSRRGQGLPRLGEASRARSARPATSSTRAAATTSWAGRSVGGGEQGFDHDLTGWTLKGKHASTDCDDCHKATRQGRASRRTWAPTGCAARATPRISRTSSSVRARHARVRALPHRERVEAARSRTMQFNHDDRKDARCRCSAAHRDVACSKCHPKAVFNLPFAQARRVRQQRLSPEPARRPPVRQAAVRVVPLADVQDAQAAELRSHGEDASSTSARAPQAQVLRLPHQGARRGQAERARASCATRRTTTTAEPVQGVRRSAEVRHVPPVGGREVTRPRSTTTRDTQVRARVQARARSACRAVSPRQGRRRTSRTSATSIDKKGNASAWAATRTRRSTPTPDHPKGKYKNSECLQCHMHPGDPTIRTGKDNKMVVEVHGLARQLPAGQGAQGRAVRRLPHEPRQGGKTSFAEISAELQRRQPVPRGLAAQGLARHRVHRVPRLRACGTRSSSITSSRSPRTPRARSIASRSRASTRRTSARPATRRREFAGRRADVLRRGLPRRRRRAQGPPRRRSARSATSRPATTSSTTTRCRRSTSTAKHLEVRCADCHPSVTFKPRPKNCFGCHPEPTVHKGQYGTGVRAVPLDADVRRTSSRCTTSATSR